MAKSDVFLQVTQRRSAIGRPVRQRRTLTALGLRRVGQQVQQLDNAAIRGMIARVAHLVRVEEVPS